MPDVPAYLTAEYYQARRPVPPSWPDTDPVPEVRSTDPVPAGAPPHPRAVRSLLAAVANAGWAARVGYSRGPARAVKVGTYKMVEAFGVWTAAHPDTGYRVRAVYGHTVASSSWAWDIAIWMPGSVRPRFLDATISDLIDFIAVRGSVNQAWFKGITARVAQQKEDQKAKAKARPKKAKEGSS